MKQGGNDGCIVILGGPNDQKGNLSAIAKSRLIQGSKELSFNPGYKILLTGGYGKQFNETNQPHWSYAKAFLIDELSISPDSFLFETIESSNTVEDIEMAKPVLKKYGFSKVLIITSAFHLPRVKFILEKAMEPNATEIIFSSASDSDIDESLLKKLYGHEQQALNYLEANYKATRNDR